jgi:Flp pilus assembly protein TadD
MFSINGRFANAGVAYLAYVEKMLLPFKLAVLYLRPLAGWPVWQIVLGFLFLGGMSALAIGALCHRRRSYLTVGWFWYVGMLMPVIGIVQVGSQAFANRYTYLPLIGWFIILTWGGAESVTRWRVPARLVWCVSLLLIAGLAALTCREAGYWGSSEMLFRRCLELNDDNYMAHNGLGVEAAGREKFEESRDHFLEAIRIYPQYASALQNLGSLLAMHGDFAQAKPYLSEAVRLEPQAALVFSKLGLVLSERGDFEPGICFYREYLRFKPDDEKVCNNLAWILATNPDAKFRSGAEAVCLAEHACTLTQYQETVYIGTLAAAYAEAGRFQDAVTTAERAAECARKNREEELEQTNLRLLDLYRAGKAYHEEKPEGKQSAG